MGPVIWDWVIGMLVRPGATFLRAREHLRFGYWWIVLMVFVVETGLAIYTSPMKAELLGALGNTLFTQGLFMLTVFYLQALFLMASARVFEWQITWQESLKYAGLAWAILLVEDIANIYPLLKHQEWLALGVSGFFLLWFCFSFAAGIRRLTGLAAWKAAVFAVMAAWPWPIGILIWNATTLRPGV
jgi:hypothetical protein